MTPRRITFVAEQLLGYFRTGGLGSATTFLALAFARLGHDVEVLFFGTAPTEPIDPEWTTLYEQTGVRIREVPHIDHAVEPSYFKKMREIELALRADPPDVVIAQDLAAPAYSALRLRQLGLAFQETLFVVICHGTRQWITNMARKVRVLPGALAVANLERLGVALADVAVSPSAYMVEWMRAQGWQLPERTEVIPLLTRSVATGETPPQAARADGTVDRLAFFGRLEERKGVRPFVAALNELPTRLLEGVDLEFVGRATKNFPPPRVEALLSESARSALRSISFATELDQHEALERLSRPATLAVIPSLEDNSPMVVYECMERSIPFLASAAGGTAELIAPEDRARVLFSPTTAGVAAALERVLSGDVAPARAAFDGETSLERWADVLALEPRRVVRLPGRPRVDVVAEGGEVPAGDAPWVLLFDGDDAAAENFVEALLRAQAASGADVVTCGLRVSSDGGSYEQFFSGEPRGLGIVANDYGTVALIRRELLEELGGRWGAARDGLWPLFAALSARGAHFVSVPLPLVETGIPPGSLERDPGDALLVVEQLGPVLPDHLRGLARLAAGLVAETRRPAPPRVSTLRRVLRRLRR